MNPQAMHCRTKTSLFCSTASKVMITTGNPKAFARKTEIVDVTNGITCTDLANFPVTLAGAVGANLRGSPVVCGGYGHSGSSDKCYRFKNGMWKEFASLKEKREYATGVVYNKKLHMFGGYNGSRLDTSETINVDGKVSEGPDLPTAVRLHAMTSINDIVSLLSGGSTNSDSYSAQTWFYNHDTEFFTSGPDLLEGRRRHGSATNVDKVTNSKIAVITGGYNGNTMDSTEMLINGQWQTGTIQCRKQKYFDFL